MKATLGITLAALALVGCGVETTKQVSVPKPAAPPAGAVTLQTLDAVKKAKQPYKIVLIVKTRNNPFFRPMISEFEKTCKDLGAAPEVQAPPQEMDYEKQVALIQTEVGKGAKAICIAPADSKGIVPALVAAQKAGVLIVNVDNRIDAPAAAAQGLKAAGYVGADNEAGGRLAGAEMLKALSGKGDVAILEGIRGADNAEARKRGFTEAVKGHLNVVAAESANWDTEQAYQKTQNILAARPSISGIFCANDKMAVGAMKAIAEAGKKGKIAVVGYDNIPDVQPAIASGELKATIEQRPDLMGRYGARMAIGALNGDVPLGGEILVPLEAKHR
ncbi:MAG TPA: substrate-binding domain-containing protein [Armatimonadota bacterium]|jgi:ribose transport system substrate-binding protein